MAKITSFTVASPDHPIYTGKWVISKQGPPKQNKEIDMATIKTTVVDSPEKMHVWSKPVLQVCDRCTNIQTGPFR